MSIEALRWALEVGEEQKLEPIKRHILLILGNRADETGYLYPSISWVCQRTGYSRRAVQINCGALEKAALFTRAPRANASGDRTSDGWQLAMKQPGLPLGTPRALDAPPRARDSTPPAHRQRPPGAPDAPNTQDKTQDQKKDAGRAKTPSPVSRCFKAYQDGIKAKYGTTYPPSAKANGQLAQVVARVGADHAEQVVVAYLASQNPWYGKVKHKIDFLVRDAEQLYMDLQAAGVAGAPAPKVARLALLAEDGRVMKHLDDVPAGDMSQIALKSLRDYAGLVAHLEPRYIAVRQGTERRQYSIEELSQAARAHA